MIYLLGGGQATYSARDLIFGFESKVTDNVNKGSLLQGNLYVDNTVTPVLNYFMGPTSGRKYKLLTGKEDVTEASTIYSIDGYDTALLKEKMWDGYEW